jgi:hypothetical protein
VCINIRLYRNQRLGQRRCGVVGVEIIFLSTPIIPSVLASAQFALVESHDVWEYYPILQLLLARNIRRHGSCAVPDPHRSQSQPYGTGKGTFAAPRPAGIAPLVASPPE